jgi:hypothetical protein
MLSQFFMANALITAAAQIVPSLEIEALHWLHNSTNGDSWRWLNETTYGASGISPKM